MSNTVTSRVPSPPPPLPPSAGGLNGHVTATYRLAPGPPVAAASSDAVTTPGYRGGGPSPGMPPAGAPGRTPAAGTLARERKGRWWPRRVRG